MGLKPSLSNRRSLESEIQVKSTEDLLSTCLRKQSDKTKLGTGRKNLIKKSDASFRHVVDLPTIALAVKLRIRRFIDLFGGMRCGAGRAGDASLACWCAIGSPVDLCFPRCVYVTFVLKVLPRTKVNYEMVLHKKKRKMIYDVYCFMKREADNNAVDNLKQCMKRTAAATKCSVATVRRIVKSSKDSEFLTVFRTPGKNKRNKQKPITDIDSFDQGVIKRIIHNFHVTEKELPTIDGPTKGNKKPLSKGNRLVIVHAGGEAGFVPNALLTFKAGTKSGDYHDNMNSENYERWLRTKLIPNLPPNSVVIVDNASYHNKQLDAAPTSNTKKVDMQTWLRQKEIQFEESMLKPELYNLIKKYKEQFRKFNIDAILNEAGHAVLRLPPYHPDLNPIEMAWSQIKGYVANKNVSWNLARIADLVNEKVNLMGATEWAKLCTKDDDSESNDDESSSDRSDDDEMATSSTNTASSLGFHVTHDDLMEGVSPLI
ncbi:hypothetical protein EVAR_82385_1 [Eumeta japonica]|uniref:Tc1-like transposase DDE domain-containing protein n=1 Tax=Eumeta variegata TaxID=151549 RepID=A0A4C1UAU7_EUMVA|nr:hypothetical protein EVAR_82385_1 [Eumeta japonica]